MSPLQMVRCPEFSSPNQMETQALHVKSGLTLETGYFPKTG